MKIFSIKNLIIGLFIIITFVISIMCINSFDTKKYVIAPWQVGNDTDVFSSRDLPNNIDTINVSNIKKVKRYETALIDAAVKAGMNRKELNKVFKSADKDGPKGKVPIYVENDGLNGVPVIIIVYKNAYDGPRSKLSDGEWVEIVEKKDYKVLFSTGSI